MAITALEGGERLLHVPAMPRRICSYHPPVTSDANAFRLVLGLGVSLRLISGADTSASQAEKRTTDLPEYVNIGHHRYR